MGSDKSLLIVFRRSLHAENGSVGKKVLPLSSSGFSAVLVGLLSSFAFWGFSANAFV